MAMIQLQSEVSINELVNGVERLSTPELEDFVAKILAAQARRRVSSLPKSEADLLQRINQGLSSSEQKRFDELNEKRREESLTSDEHQELIQLIEHVEHLDVQRIQYLAELAKLRNIPIRELMKQLEIRPVPTHG